MRQLPLFENNSSNLTKMTCDDVFCRCGCGTKVYNGKKWVCGHNNKYDINKVTETKSQSVKLEKNCLYCNTPFYPKSRHVCYCSVDCQVHGRILRYLPNGNVFYANDELKTEVLIKKYKIREKRTCFVCNSVYEPDGALQVFCSDTCKSVGYKKGYTSMSNPFSEEESESFPLYGYKNKNNFSIRKCRECGSETLLFKTRSYCSQCRPLIKQKIGQEEMETNTKSEEHLEEMKLKKIDNRREEKRRKKESILLQKNVLPKEIPVDYHHPVLGLNGETLRFVVPLPRTLHQKYTGCTTQSRMKLHIVFCLKEIIRLFSFDVESFVYNKEE